MSSPRVPPKRSRFDSTLTSLHQRIASLPVLPLSLAHVIAPSPLFFPLFSPDHRVVDENNLTVFKMEEPEVDDELEAVAKHFGKELDDITLEALVKLEETSREKDGGSDDLWDPDQPKREAPSLASILGKMPSAATLGLKQSIGDCMGSMKENGERSEILCLPSFHFLLWRSLFLKKAKFKLVAVNCILIFLPILFQKSNFISFFGSRWFPTPFAV